MRPIILASSSPRRRELLALSGLPFSVRPTAAVEVPLPGEAPAAFAQRMSHAKALAVAVEAAEPEALVIGADTIVVLDDEIIGKPADAAHALEILRRLRGREHTVLTALTLIDTAAVPAAEAEHTELVATPVPMRAYSDDEIDAYVATGNPLDKAGAYAIQFADFQPVDLARFTGCFANVMGLPVCRLLRLLAERGVTPPAPLSPSDCEQFEARGCPIVPNIVMESAH